MKQIINTIKQALLKKNVLNITKQIAPIIAKVAAGKSYSSDAAKEIAIYLKNNSAVKRMYVTQWEFAQECKSGEEYMDKCMEFMASGESTAFVSDIAVMFGTTFPEVVEIITKAIEHEAEEDLREGLEETKA